MCRSDVSRDGALGSIPRQGKAPKDVNVWHQGSRNSFPNSNPATLDMVCPGSSEAESSQRTMTVASAQNCATCTTSNTGQCTWNPRYLQAFPANGVGTLRSVRSKPRIDRTLHARCHAMSLALYPKTLIFLIPGPGSRNIIYPYSSVCPGPLAIRPKSPDLAPLFSYQASTCQCSNAAPAW
jgi:hypothetical protein